MLQCPLSIKGNGASPRYTVGNYVTTEEYIAVFSGLALSSASLPGQVLVERMNLLQARDIVHSPDTRSCPLHSQTHSFPRPVSSPNAAVFLLPWSFFTVKKVILLFISQSSFKLPDSEGRPECLLKLQLSRCILPSTTPTIRYLQLYTLVIFYPLSTVD